MNKREVSCIVGIVIGLLIVIASLPVAIAQDIDEREYEDDFLSLEEINSERTITFSGDDAQSLREMVDSLGDSNWEVSLSEIEIYKDYQIAYTETTNSSYVLDGMVGEYSNVQLQISGFQGAVNSTGVLELIYNINFLFPGIDGEKDTHTLEIFNPNNRNASYNLSIMDGYKIDFIDGLEDIAISSDKKTAEGNLVGEDITVEFSKTEGYANIILIVGIVSVLGIVGVVSYAMIKKEKHAKLPETESLEDSTS